MSFDLSAGEPDYRAWVLDVKTRFRQVQLKAAVAVNTSLLQFYWELGADIVSKQHRFTWGTGFLIQLSQDLQQAFPNMTGFSVRNLKYIRQWHLFWMELPIGQQPVAQLTKQPVSQLLSIPWGHNLAILAKCKQHAEALYDVHNTQQATTAQGSGA